MKNQVLVKRYTLGLIKSIKDEREFAILKHQIFDIEEFLSKQSELKDVLSSPFFPTTKKIEIAREIFSKIQLKKKALRFLLILVENKRLELLPDIIELMPDLWNSEKGIATFEVSSVVPLTEDQKKKLKKGLEQLEKKQVALKYRIDSSLIGGISIKKENLVYDASVKGNLLKIKEKICEG